ncbi:MAG TPA: glutaminase A [Enteractinococcus sp.]
MRISPLHRYLSDLLDNLRPMTAGTVNPVTEVAVQPDLHKVAITLTTVNGFQYSSGDSDHKFAIQSIAKVFAYGLALDDLGPTEVSKKVDVEPSGDPFNEISLQHSTGRPANPMINAGAIATVGLIKGRGGVDRLSRIRRVMDLAAEGSPGELEINRTVYHAENISGHRNRALAWLLRSFEIIDSDPEPVVQDYFLECSTDVTTENLSMMAATLANKGVNPVTGKEVFSEETTRQILAVMMTCGMYDAAGNWMIDIGLPAKSGVDGGILVVVPGQLGIGVYSAPLDSHGNSVRGAAAIRRVTRDLGLHYADAPPLGGSTLRAHYSLADASLGVVRSTELSRITSQFGDRCQILEVSGDLGFAETETMARTIVEFDDEVSMVIIDFQGVDDFGRAAVLMLASLTASWRAERKDIIFIDWTETLVESLLEYAAVRDDIELPDPREKAKAASAGHLDLPWDAETPDEEITGEFRLFDNRSAALEWAELRLAQRYARQILQTDDAPREPQTAPVFDFLEDRDVDVLSSYMELRSYTAGTVIRRVGQPFGGIYFIRSGRVELAAEGKDDTRYRHVYLSPGSTFGEFALSYTGRQLTTIRAIDDVEVLVLSAQQIAEIEKTDPQLAIRLWTAIAREAYTVLEQSSREAGAREEYDPDQD